MSVATTHVSYECDHCEGPFPQGQDYRGSFCSSACYFRFRGEKILDHITQDHRFCATCFRPIKTIEQPPAGYSLVVGPVDHDQASNRASDVLVGYQYPTEHTVWATDEFETDAGTRAHRSRWSCECGNVDPSHRDDILEGFELSTVVAQLHACLETIHDEGQLAHEPDRHRLFDALREEWRDWAYAIGRAVYG